MDVIVIVLASKYDIARGFVRRNNNVFPLKIIKNHLRGRILQDLIRGLVSTITDTVDCMQNLFLSQLEQNVKDS